MSERRRTERLTWSKATGKAFNHGTVMAYKVHQCRCDECWEVFSSSPSYQRELELQRRLSDKAARKP